MKGIGNPFGLEADDDGFVGSPNRMLRVLNCKPDSIRDLEAFGFIMILDSGVAFITDWQENNYIQRDRYNPTIYQSQYKLLLDKGLILNKDAEKNLKDNPKNLRNDDDIDTDIDMDTECIQIGNTGACADGLCPRIAEIKCPSIADNIVHSIA